MFSAWLLVVLTPSVVIDNTGQLGTVHSSIRFKNNVTPLSDPLTVKLLNLNPVSFTDKHDESVINYGLIAEEIVKVFPELVLIDKENLPMCVKYDQFISLLLYQNKILNDKYLSFEKEINEIKAKIV